MTITQAKAVADDPSSFTQEEWREALARIYRTQNNQHTERAQRRFERRVQNLQDHIRAISETQ